MPSFEEEAAMQCRRRWHSLAKPPGSLGRLEDALAQIAGITGDAGYTIDKRGVLVLCADNGVVQQRVTETSSSITSILAAGVATGKMTVNKMATLANADVVAVDMGIVQPPVQAGLLDRRIASGTGDISRGPAMTKEQAEHAIQTGIDLVVDMKEAGYKILCTGEAGTGNTTTSSAMAAVLLGCDVAEVTGQGAGLPPAGLAHKIQVIAKAIAVNEPERSDVLQVLAKLGGFDIAGLCGVFIGAALYRMPVLVDGFIASVAALCAVRLRPETKNVLLASHISAEPASTRVLQALGLHPLLCAEMRVGEGTGAVAALPLLDMAYAVYNEMPTLEELAIEPLGTLP